MAALTEAQIQELAKEIHESIPGDRCAHWTGGSACQAWAKTIAGSDWIADLQRKAVLDFVDHVAYQAAYNGAPDPGQRFYNEGLNTWLREVAWVYAGLEVLED